LKRAVERQEFFLHYQPLIEIETGRLSGFEALLRWQHPELGLVPPLNFIPSAESTGLIVPIGEWVLQTACRQSCAWTQEGFTPVPMAVNISVRQLHQRGLGETVMRILKETGLAPGFLILEITESAAMHNIEDAIEILGELHGQGVQIVIDDFGSGYSSLSWLRRLPIQALKIDRAFIQHIVDDPADAAIVRAIIAMAHSLNIRVVAEGVETREQLQFLHSLKWTFEGILKCDQAQGFLFSKPLPAEEIHTLLVRQQREDGLIPIG
jgi:EAL domain-containing protein (putative c-di-GMP-specific phosphodiesterase class I)